MLTAPRLALADLSDVASAPRQASAQEHGT
jgi:hypothetical protein